MQLTNQSTARDLLGACTLWVSLAAQPAASQTVVARYIPSHQDPESYTHELIFAFDFTTRSMMKIDGNGEVLLFTPEREKMTGLAGESYFTNVGSGDPDKAIRIASMAFPDLHTLGFQSDPNIDFVESTGKYGGNVYIGEFPNGNRLLITTDLPDRFRPKTQSVLYHFDANHRLREIERPKAGYSTPIDYAEADSYDIQIADSIANGAWVYHSSEVYPNGKPELFSSSHATDYCRQRALALANSRRDAKQKELSSPEGRRAVLKRNTELHQLGNVASLPHRIPLIVAGSIICAIGSLAWWRNRT